MTRSLPTIFAEVHRAPQRAAPPVVLLNGLMMTSSAWAPFVARLDVPGAIIGCDFRGQLMSPGVPPASLEGHVADVLDLLDERGIARAHLVATSFGAGVAWLTASRYPDRVVSLSLITAGDRPDSRLLQIEEDWRQGCLAALNGGDRAAFFESVFEAVYSEDFRSRQAEDLETKIQALSGLPKSWFEALVALMASVREHDPGDELSKVACPTLVIAAEEDRVVPAARSAALAEAIPGARLEVLAGAGHGAILERPDELAKMVSGFIAARSDAPRREDP